MEVSLQVPDDIAERLTASRTDLSRQALEALATAAYRAGILTAQEVERMLGFTSRWQTEAFLRQAGAYLDYTEEDLLQDLESLRGQVAG